MHKNTKKDINTPHNRLGDIVADLARLKDRAKHCDTEDVSMIADSAFKLCFSIYSFQCRGEYPAAKSRQNRTTAPRNGQRRADAQD